MIPLTLYRNRAIAVFGLGLSGLATVQALKAGGALPRAWDDSDQGRQKARELKIHLEDLYHTDWSTIDSLVVAPGVPLTHPKPHPLIQLARSAGIPVIGDTELFFQQKIYSGTNSKVFVITGTNGKSTTTALTAHLLQSGGLNVQLGGNIGRAVLSLDDFKDENFYVIEFSSYQIDLTPTLAADAAVLLNISPDHLDRHGSLENYAAIKSRILSGLKPNSDAIIGVDDEHCQKIAENADEALNLIKISVQNKATSDIQVIDGMLVDRTLDQNSCLRFDLSNINTLRGVHNWQNAAAAYALVKSANLSNNEIFEGFQSFPGLAHRLEHVGNLGNLAFYNDSKATNAEAAEKAIKEFQNIYWIAGGLAKDGGITELLPYFSHLTKAYLIGDAAESFSKTLGDLVPWEISGTLDKAIRSAKEDASKATKPDPVILLSPACASFDQFANFCNSRGPISSDRK